MFFKRGKNDNILLVIIAIGFSIAQADEPKYDDDNRCNTTGATLAQGIYIPSDNCEQTGYVCKLASNPTGTITFWLGKSADCKKFYTTRMKTCFPKPTNPNELDESNENHNLRLTLASGVGTANTFGVAVMASQLLSAKSDNARVSVIYKFIPSGSVCGDLNSISLQSVSRAE